MQTNFGHGNERESAVWDQMMRIYYGNQSLQGFIPMTMFAKPKHKYVRISCQKPKYRLNADKLRSSKSGRSL